MAEIINLRRARKSRERAEARASGDANAAKHGLHKSARKKAEAEAVREATKLDAHKVEDRE